MSSNGNEERIVERFEIVDVHIGNVKAVIVKGAFIQIVPLTWHSFLLPVMDRHPGLTI